MVDSVPGAYNPFVFPSPLQFQYFQSPVTSTRPMDRRAANGRRERMTYDRNQLKTLEDQFKLTPYPDASKREQLAKILHLEENRIQVWFKNRRAKQRGQAKASTPGGREDGGSSSVSPKDQQPRFKPVSELPFIPMPTPPKEEEDTKIEASAFTSIKKDEEMIIPSQPILPPNMEAQMQWANYCQMFPMHYYNTSSIDYSNFVGQPYSYPPQYPMNF
ncbi:hypothetical protein PRIPAC_74375 [Pristionchus pacificus]|uniref:Homeobox domain-containing protein n=1 Tax=Pristionchus pacificus TaxID=54126 RepID=A0A2A6D035_PRIPA|nr:hypothetical protein PRIPAC_74375 [Pristionchus pacificus]|eukprot:PDM83677.1 Homeobox domain-containing protein [Pristionchus pacificus]